MDCTEFKTLTPYVQGLVKNEFFEVLSSCAMVERWKLRRSGDRAYHDNSFQTIPTASSKEEEKSIFVLALLPHLRGCPLAFLD